MTSTVVVFVVIASVWFGSIVAIAPCNEAIVAAIKCTPECYDKGKVPTLVTNGEKWTISVISKPDMPGTVQCVTSYQAYPKAYVTPFYKAGGNTTSTYTQEKKDIYIAETDAQGTKYRVYVISYKCHMYGYYRCLDTTSGGNSGNHSVVAFVACKYEKDQAAIQALAQAKTCFRKIGITNIKDQQVCQC